MLTSFVTTQFLKTIPPPPKLDMDDMPAVRALMAERERLSNEALGPPGPEVKESYQTVKMRDGYESKIKIIQPTKVPANGSPLIVLFHGGGFCFGSLDQMTAYSRGFVKLFGAVCISVAYRLSPEHPFPTPINDAWDSVKWIASNAPNLGASEHFILGGVSAGGSLAALTTHLAKDEELFFPVTGQWLCIPLIFDEGLVPQKYESHWISREQNANVAGLNADSIKGMNKNWKPDTKSPLYSPMNRSSGLRRLPPAYIQVNGME